MEDKRLLIEAKGVSKVFHLGGGLTKRKLVAVNDANLEISLDTPEIYTLAGESGSGKSTLARMILGVHDVTSGDLLYKGKPIPISDKRPAMLDFMKDVQSVFQNPFETFNPLKRVDTYLFDTAINFGLVPKNSKDWDPVEDALKMVGLTIKDVVGKYPNEFSGGQLQRISIARSLITKPKVLVADEPVSMVDASLRMSIVNLFKDLKEKRGVTILYITHDLATAYYVSDHIAIMQRGFIVEQGPVDKILDSPRHAYTQLLKDSVPNPDPRAIWDQDIALSKIEEDEFNLSGCKFAERCPRASERCFHEEPHMYDLVDEGVKVRCFSYER